MRSSLITSNKNELGSGAWSGADMPLRIAFNSYTGCGAWFILRLLEEGHSVDYFISKPDCENILNGIIPSPVIIDRSSLPNYSRYDLSIFDTTGRKKQAEYSADLCPTIGDGNFNCELEDNREFGIKIMEDCGILVPPYEKFSDPKEGKKYVRTTGKCYVYKPDTPAGQEQDTDTTFVSCSVEDMLEHIDKLFEDSKRQPFILQEVIKGCEVSTEGWFNGEDFFIRNSTLELKKFMNDDKGPATGCSGNMVFIHGLGEPKIYREGLRKTKDYLKEIGFTGMLDLNSIVSDDKLYGIEWTPRFGYDATAALATMYAGDFGNLLEATARGERPEQSYRAEFCASVRLSIPPYPVKDRDIKERGNVIEGIDEEDFCYTYLYDVEKTNGCLHSAGHNGFIASPMGVGNTPGEAFHDVSKRVDHVKAAGLQYRTDVEKKILKRYAELQEGGWLR
jgi:phosphoribosylamine-glycine ligase